MQADELRTAYLDFFVGKGHQLLPSAPLVPHGDSTLLFTGAGMVQFKPYFLGQRTPESRRVTTCQRCLRTPDIDNVGLTDRHATFFEMLGNFSFGDYFKREAIEWSWEFVTARLAFSPDQLWITIYDDDDEAFKLWNEGIGVPADRIVRLGREDNFWEIGVGPCGPCSEIHADRGPAFGCGRPNCQPGCSCQRFLEIWNLVFIQFHQDEAGRLHPLPQKSIDTGMGLERTVALLQGVRSIFETDLVRPILDAVAARAGVRYGSDPKADVSLRVITDHMRGVTFLVMDGVLPSNEGRGYVLRRLLRRSVRHGRLLGIDGPFLVDIARVVAEQMRAGYPEVAEKLPGILPTIAAEERRFHETLDQGIAILNDVIATLRAQGQGEVPGDAAFRLHDTYGFPFELLAEIVGEAGYEVDRAGFDREMARQRARARAARSTGSYLGEEAQRFGRLVAGKSTRFVGYDQLEAESRLLGLLVEGEAVDRAPRGERVELLLDVTPFYAEGGGQVADTGTITSPTGQVVIDGVKRIGDGAVVHRGRVVAGEVGAGQGLLATVDRRDREATERHHTATHLLHKALHETLGPHARQAGSLVAPERLRFDFTHSQPATPAELAEIEQQVNAHILQNLPVGTHVTSFAEAERLGAMALFGEKYGERVRVVSIGEYSRELCGGTHVRQSGDLGLFKVVSETGVAAGVRRIEAVAGGAALHHVVIEEAWLARAAQRLGVSPSELPDQAEKVMAQVRELTREVERLRSQVAQARAAELVGRAEPVGGVRLLVTSLAGESAAELRILGDQLRDRLGGGLVVLGSVADGRAQMVAMAGDAAVRAGIDAGQIVREAAPLVGGRGGGRAQKAEGGGARPEGLSEALDRAKDAALRQLAVAQRG